MKKTGIFFKKKQKQNKTKHKNTVCLVFLPTGDLPTNLSRSRSKPRSNNVCLQSNDVTKALLFLIIDNFHNKHNSRELHYATKINHIRHITRKTKQNKKLRSILTVCLYAHMVIFQPAKHRAMSDTNLINMELNEINLTELITLKEFPPQHWCWGTQTPSGYRSGDP